MNQKGKTPCPVPLRGQQSGPNPDTGRSGQHGRMGRHYHKFLKPEGGQLF